jgi:hypothetical protein
MKTATIPLARFVDLRECCVARCRTPKNIVVAAGAKLLPPVSVTKRLLKKV